MDRYDEEQIDKAAYRKFVEMDKKNLDWDRFFMREAKAWSSRSKCLSKQIGAVLVKDRHIIATGYNGPPKGVPHCEIRDGTGKYDIVHSGFSISTGKAVCPRRRMGYESGEGLEHCAAIHAEVNPILQVARYGGCTVGTTLYCSCGIPCVNCTKVLIQAGVVRVVHLAVPIHSDKTYNFQLSAQLFKLAGVQIDILDIDEA